MVGGTRRLETVSSSRTGKLCGPKINLLQCVRLSAGVAMGWLVRLVSRRTTSDRCHLRSARLKSARLRDGLTDRFVTGMPIK